MNVIPGLNHVRFLRAYAILADRYSMRTYAMPVLGESHYYAAKSGPVPSQRMGVLKKGLSGTTLQERVLLDSSIRQTSEESVVIDTLNEYDLMSNADIEAPIPTSKTQCTSKRTRKYLRIGRQRHSLLHTHGNVGKVVMR